MPWQEGAPHAGFTTAERPWLPVPSAHHSLALDRQERETDGLVHAWRRFLRWRKIHPALISGSIRMLSGSAPVLAFERGLDGERILAAFNFSACPIRMALPESACVSLAGHGFEAELSGGELALPAHGVFFGSLEPAASEKIARQFEPAQ